MRAIIDLNKRWYTVTTHLVCLFMPCVAMRKLKTVFAARTCRSVFHRRMNRPIVRLMICTAVDWLIGAEGMEGTR